MVPLEAAYRRAASTARLRSRGAATDRGIVRSEGATELLTSYTTGEGEPWPFYERFGFVPTGELDAEGEVILRLHLTK